MNKKAIGKIKQLKKYYTPEKGLEYVEYLIRQKEEKRAVKSR